MIIFLCGMVWVFDEFWLGCECRCSLRGGSVCVIGGVGSLFIVGIGRVVGIMLIVEGGVEMRDWRD